MDITTPENSLKGITAKTGAALCDSFWIFCLSLAFARILDFPALPQDWTWALIFLPALTFFIFLKKRDFASPGSRLWLYFLQRQRRTWAAFLSVLFLLGHFIAAYWHVQSDPLQSKSQVISMPAFAPTLTDHLGIDHDSSAWMRLPFYYTLGAWLKTFQGKPVTYAFAYQPGLPDKFPGTIHARWNADITVQIESPWTPLEKTERKGNPYPSDQIMACLTSSWFKPVGMSFSRCQEIRRNVLGLQLKKLLEIGARNIELAWYHVPNPELPTNERSQGLYLSTTHENKIYERFVVITPHGSQQAFMLSRSAEGSESALASQYFRQIIGSMHLQSQLNAGRALVNVLLSQASLPKQDDMEDPLAYLKKLAQAQALLLAKITVEPKDKMAYYHLGGTAYYIARFAAHQRTRTTQIVSSDLLEILDNVTETSMPTLNSAWRYSQDLSPNSEQTAKLHEHWQELSKK